MANESAKENEKQSERYVTEKTITQTAWKELPYKPRLDFLDDNC